MGTLDTRGGHPVSPDDYMSDPFEDAIDAIDRERKYQQRKWGDLDERNGIADFILYMRRELDLATQTGYVGPGIGETHAMAQIRKVAAIGVAAMERFGAGKKTGRHDSDLYPDAETLKE